MLSKIIVRKELMHIAEDTQVPPEWVNKWRQSHIIFVTLLVYKNHTLVCGSKCTIKCFLLFHLPVMQ